MDKDPAKDFLVFQEQRRTMSLCKILLTFLEDLKENKKCISDKEYQRFRKRILDHGNDSIREFEEYVSRLKVNL